MKLVNFAHGEFLMAGMYVAVGLASLGTLPGAFGMFGIYWVAIPTMFVMAAVGLAFYLLLLDRAARFGESPQILLTIGLSIGAQGLAQVLRGSGFKLVPNSHQRRGNPLRRAQPSARARHRFHRGARRHDRDGLGSARDAFWQERPRGGRERRNCGDARHRRTPRLHRVDPRSPSGWSAWLQLSSSPISTPFPNVGQNFVVVAFLAIVIAGLGNVVGAVFGGLLMGVMQSLTASYFDLDLSTAAIYLLFLAVLLLRPQGLFTRGRAHAVRRALVIFARGWPPLLPACS